MVQPILNNSVETASKGFAQGIAKSFDVILGSQDFLLLIGAIILLVIIWRLMK